MPVRYLGVEEAIARSGLRMVVVGNVPSPWGEAAKGILHIKRLEWAAVRLVYDSEPLKQWAGQRSGPVAIFDNEPPRSGWSEILLLAERLAPTPSLLPAVDIYSATFMTLFRPLPPEHCAMDAASRAAMETRDPATDAALDPVLLRHRDMMYAEHLELPLTL